MKSVTVGWFEIPVEDMGRAIFFYESVFDCKLERHDMGPLKMAWFPWDENGTGAGGSLVKQDKFYKPSTDGIQIYFSSEDLDVELARVDAAGGRVISPKKEISADIGFMASFMDSEGNRIAIHSKK